MAKERGLIFQDDNVLSVLAGTKTQTRRIIPDDWWRCLDPDDDEDRTRALNHCRYGQVGDALWIKEAWRVFDVTGYESQKEPGAVIYRADSPANWSGPWNPSMFMPKWAARPERFRLTERRIERLHEITEEDARAEGVTPLLERFEHLGRDQRIDGDLVTEKPYRTSFVCRWDEINGDRVLFSANPWVWVLTFGRI